MVDLPITKWIKKKIRRLIAIVEDTDVATHSIASGKYVVWKGDLCKSTAPIAVGGALSLSNLSPVSDGGLNELSEQIGTVSANLASISNKHIQMVGLGNFMTNGSLTLNDSIENYDIIAITIFDIANSAVHGFNMCPKDIFKLYNTSAHALGVSCYVIARSYAYVNYVSANVIGCQVSEGYGGAVYGIKW